MNLNWFQVHGKGAAVTAPPEVTATATPATGQAPLEVAVQRDGDRPRGRGADLPVGLRRHRHDRRHVDRRRTRPTRTRNAGTYTAKVTVTDAEGQQGTATVDVRVTGAPNQCPTRTLSRTSSTAPRSTLDRWTVIRPQPRQRSASRDGELELPIDNGSIYQARHDARATSSRSRRPSGEWTVTAKIRVDRAEPELPAGRPARVLRRRQLGVGAHDLRGRRRATSSSSTRTRAARATRAADKLGGIPADAPLTYYVRIRSDGTEPDRVLLVRRRHVHARSAGRRR